MRILVVTMQFPHFPAPGGETRQFCLLREAAKEHEITLVATAMPPNETAEKTLRGFLKEVIWYKWVPPSKEAANPSFLSYLKGTPTSLKRYVERREIPTYLSKLSGKPFDIIQVEHSDVAHWVNGACPGIPKILTMHNVNYLIYKRFCDIAPFSYEKVKLMLEWRSMRRYEASLSDKFEKFLAMSEEDRQLYLEIAPDADVEVVPNGVDTEYFSSDPEAEEEDALVYTAQMGWKPSEDAILWFHQEVFPKLREKYPRLKLYVVGKNPTEPIKALSGESVVVTGFVEDVRPYMNKAKVYIVPLRIGGGTRLKILEAMAMSKPVVSTSVGAEGLGVHPPKDILIADSPGDFIEAISKLIDNPQMRDSLGKAARANVVQNYDWKIIGRKLLNIYKSFDKQNF